MERRKKGRTNTRDKKRRGGGFKEEKMERNKTVREEWGVREGEKGLRKHLGRSRVRR